jgi:hypothetical protein
MSAETGTASSNGATHSESIHAAIERLAGLSEPDFLACKKAEAEKLG